MKETEDIGNSKQSKMSEACHEIVNDFMQPNFKKLNITTISRRIGVSRAWIYKYYGNNEEAILMTTTDMVASLFTSSNKSLPVVRNKVEFLEVIVKSILTTLSEVENYPLYYTYYMKIKFSDSVLTDRINFHEQLYMDSRFIPTTAKGLNCSNSEARKIATLIHALRMGLALQWLNDKERRMYGKKALSSDIERLLRPYILKPSIKN